MTTWTLRWLTIAALVLTTLSAQGQHVHGVSGSAGDHHLEDGSPPGYDQVDHDHHDDVMAECPSCRFLGSAQGILEEPASDRRSSHRVALAVRPSGKACRLTRTCFGRAPPAC